MNSDESKILDEYKIILNLISMIYLNFSPKMHEFFKILIILKIYQTEQKHSSFVEQVVNYY